MKYKRLLFLIIGMTIIIVIMIKQDVKTIEYTDYLVLTNTYPHNNTSYTQGLFFYQNKLYETTGRYHESKLYKDIYLDTNIAQESITFPEDVFIEGSCMFHDKIYVLTWKENILYKINKDSLEIEEILDYPYEGWGLTTDDEYLIASDGTSKIYFFNKELKVIKTIQVHNNKKEINNINELEYINGKIWANVYQTNKVLIINPKTGKVEKILDFSNIHKRTKGEDVLNGIAYHNSKIYITGKYWKSLYELEIK